MSLTGVQSHNDNKQGKILSSQVVQIYTEFTALLGGFSKLKFDLLDLNSKDLAEETNKFQRKVLDLDRRIGYRVLLVGSI